MVAAAGGWWSTPASGASIAAGGAVLVALITLLATPLIQARIRRRERAEEAAKFWTERGQRLCSDVYHVLYDHLHPGHVLLVGKPGSEDSNTLYEAGRDDWDNRLRQATIELSLFSPKEDVRHAATLLTRSVENVRMGSLVAITTPRDDPDRQTTYSRTWFEAMTTLGGLVETLGGHRIPLPGTSEPV